MKTTILLGLLLTLTVSCKHRSNPVTTEENFHTQEANRLVAEARNLWLPPLDSTFFFNDSEHISINDKEILAKLDSALAIPLFQMLRFLLIIPKSSKNYKQKIHSRSKNLKIWR